MKVYQCPQCGRSDGLWEGVDVPGWRTVNEKLEPVRSGSPDRDIDWDRQQVPVTRLLESGSKRVATVLARQPCRGLRDAGRHLLCHSENDSSEPSL